VKARCLASVSLVRPAPFDPDQAFAGINLETEAFESFRVTLPDQSVALVAPGETTPKQTIIHGVNVEGNRLRFVRIDRDVDEIRGLGVTQLSGIGSFAEPATARLQRTPDGEVHVTTDTGVSLSEDWLRGNARLIQVKTPDQRWRDVTDRCLSGSIPTQLVKEWSETNQRTLVDFRISR
jgi:hypothetical protein